MLCSRMFLGNPASLHGLSAPSPHVRTSASALSCRCDFQRSDCSPMVAFLKHHRISTCTGNNILDTSCRLRYSWPIMKQPKTLQQAIVFFSEPGNCLAYMIKVRWPDGVECPTCGRKDVVFLANQHKWQCKSVHHHRQFTVKVGTIFEDSPIPLEKWLPAVWVIVNCKNGISSYEVARDLGVTQKTAWFMLHRIRKTLQDS